MTLKNILILIVLTGMAGRSFAAPATLEQSITYDGETLTMQLTKDTLRGANFELLSQNGSGGYDEVTPVGERSYMGTVDEYPGAVSCGILKDDGTFWGAVYFKRGAIWYTLGTNVVDTLGLEYIHFIDYQVPSDPTIAAGQAGSTMYAYELGIDADYDYYTASGSSVATVLEGIEYSVCVTRVIYMRDVLLRPYLGRVIIRSTLAQNPYNGYTETDYMREVRLEWENEQTDTDPDLVAGLSPTKVGGGWSYRETVGEANGYSVNHTQDDGSFDHVFRHEMGHNWALNHAEGGWPEGTGLMGGNSAGRFTACEAYVVFGYRDSRLTEGGILENEGTYTAVELPPYASMDTGKFIQNVTSTLTFSVLANDHDANGQALSLSSFDGTSAHGGTVTQQGQDLVYTAPGAFVGTDYFTYTIQDTAGGTAMGVVIVDVLPNDSLRLYLPLDETTGRTTADYSMFKNNGTVSSDLSALSILGQHANAIHFDGVEDYVEVSDLTLASDTVTITAWIKPDANQSAYAGIVFARNGESASGLNIHDDGKLRYHWNNDEYTWNSRLAPPVGIWTFVALVVEPTKATIYMNDGSGFESKVHTGIHTATSLGNPSIGRDPSTSLSRYFAGGIDEVRIYNESMSQAELQNVYDGGSRAGSPNPFDGAFDYDFPEVSWAPDTLATSHEVYIGTNQAAVASAHTGSPEYQGSTTQSSWMYDRLLNTTFYWRVDTVTPSDTIAGAVWSFTTSSQVFEEDEEGLIAHWKLDDGSGLVTVDSSLNSHIGVLMNGPTWATGFTGSALSFDGGNDSVTFDTGPALNGPTDFTLSAWIKTSSATEQVILQQRSGFGTSGYNGQYQFKINANGTVGFFVFGNSAYQYDFGTTATVNDGQWHFVSAVRDGTNGLIYIDGNPVPAASASGIIRDLDASISVGMGLDIRDNDKPFNGLIDDAKIYALALGGSELAALYSRYLDTDADGMPNGWEIDHGLNPLVDDTAGNPDSDPFNNWFEYVADTDPLDGDSWQTFSGELSPETGEVTLRFRTSANRNYAVEYRADLTSGTWQDLGSVFSGTGLEMTVQDAASGPHRYYRLRIQLP